MANFDTAIAYVLADEGGLVNNPHDDGGQTNFGVTAKAYGGDVSHITVDDAKRFHRANYWDPMHLDQCPSQVVATALLDVAVNRGVHRAETYEAEIYNFLGQSASDKAFIEELSKRLAADYRRIVQIKPDKAVFLKGWLNRAERLKTLV